MCITCVGYSFSTFTLSKNVCSIVHIFCDLYYLEKGKVNYFPWKRRFSLFTTGNGTTKFHFYPKLLWNRNQIKAMSQWTSFGFKNGHCTVFFLILHHDSFLGHFLFLEMKTTKEIVKILSRNKWPFLNHISTIFYFIQWLLTLREIWHFYKEYNIKNKMGRNWWCRWHLVVVN